MGDAAMPDRRCQCGCGAPVKRTFVRGHHMRLAGAHPPPKPVADRIRESAHVAPDTGCWLWSLHVDKDGYGSIKVEGRTRYVARVSYETFVGEVPADRVVHPSCGVRHCVNPDHLEAITRQEQIARGDSDPRRNFADYYERRRNAPHCPNGHPWDDENTRWADAGDGYRPRVCRACQREGMQERRADPAFVETERVRNRELYSENADHIRERKRAASKARYAAARASGRCVARGCAEDAAPGRSKCTIHLREGAARTWGLKRYPLVDIYAARGLTACWLCGGDFTGDDPMWHDHLIPRSLGGPDEPWNLAPAHRSCNIRRRDMPLAETVATWHPAGLPDPVAGLVADALRRSDPCH